MINRTLLLGDSSLSVVFTTMVNDFEDSPFDLLPDALSTDLTVLVGDFGVFSPIVLEDFDVFTFVFVTPVSSIVLADFFSVDEIGAETMLPLPSISEEVTFFDDVFLFDLVAFDARTRGAENTLRVLSS